MALFIVAVAVAFLTLFWSVSILKGGLNGIRKERIIIYRWWAMFTETNVSGVKDNMGCEPDERLLIGPRARRIGAIYILMGVLILTLGCFITFIYLKSAVLNLLPLLAR